MKKEFLEIEVKYGADNIDRMAFKSLVRRMGPKSFIYAESADTYYVAGEDDFLRYRMPMENSLNGVRDARAELTFKKKHTEANNIVRTEVNLRVDQNSPELIHAFCEGLGYRKNFSVYKMCDIYFFDDATVVYYTVQDEDFKQASFIEIEVEEDLNVTQEQAKEILQKYEKRLAPLGITPQHRKKLSLYEMYVRK